MESKPRFRMAGAPELLHAAPAPPDGAGLAAALPHLCMPDGVSFRDEPPPPPRFFTSSLPGGVGDGTASAHLACCLFYEELPAARMLPLLNAAINNQPSPGSPNASTPHSPQRTPSSSHVPLSSTASTPRAVSGSAFAGAAAPEAEPPSPLRMGMPSSRTSNAPKEAPAAVPPPPPVDVSDSTTTSAAPTPRHEPPPPSTTASASAPATEQPELTTKQKHKRREEAIKTLREMGLPLGVCAVALHQANDDVPAALQWLEHGRGLQLLKAYEAVRSGQQPSPAAFVSPSAAPDMATPPPSPPPSPPTTPPQTPIRYGSAAALSAGLHSRSSSSSLAGGEPRSPSRLWALKAIAILSPWPLHAFWREYLHALLCAFLPNLTVPIEIRILQATNAEQMTVSKADKKLEGDGRCLLVLLPRSGGLPPEATASILSAGGPSTLRQRALSRRGRSGRGCQRPYLCARRHRRTRRQLWRRRRRLSALAAHQPLLLRAAVSLMRASYTRPSGVAMPSGREVANPETEQAMEAAATARGTQLYR